MVIRTGDGIALEFAQNRMRKIGISHVTFSSVLNESCTEMERYLEGRRMTIAEAISLVEEHEGEIGRRVFQAEVVF